MKLKLHPFARRVGMAALWEAWQIFRAEFFDPQREPSSRPAVCAKCGKPVSRHPEGRPCRI